MRFFLIRTTLLLFLCLPAAAAGDECMEGDCDNGFGTGFTEAGTIYKGEWRHGLPHGQGTEFLGKGQERSGTWQEGELVAQEEGAP